MEKPIFSTVQGLMEHRKQNQRTIKTLIKARKALVLNNTTSTVDPVTMEMDALSLVKEIESLLEELQPDVCS